MPTDACFPRPVLTIPFFLAAMILASASTSRAAPDRQSRVPKKQLASSCQAITVTPAGKLVDFKAPSGMPAAKADSLVEVVAAISGAMATGDAQKLAGFFHPRLKLNVATISSQLAEIRARYGEPVSFNPLKLLLVRSPGGDTTPVACDFDGVVLNPLYGYDHQASLWFQATGQQDIARVMMGIVPLPDRLGGGWRIGNFHTQQWTHAGRDPLAWIETARTARSAKNALAAWTMFDITEKLLRPSAFAAYQAHDMVAVERDSLMSRADWLAAVSTTPPDLKVEGAVSLLVRGGAGILYKLRLVKELSSNEIQEHCRSTAKNLMARKDTKGLAGIRCEYYRPGESLNKDSVIGGLFVPITE
ncbi:MAG: hypothetical protein RIQ81_765 [Pseudomonadota bacterium]